MNEFLTFWLCRLNLGFDVLSIRLNTFLELFTAKKLTCGFLLGSVSYYAARLMNFLLSVMIVWLGGSVGIKVKVI